MAEMFMKNVLRVWDWLERYWVGVSGFICTIIVLYSVFMRYILKNAPEWSEEVVIYIFIMAFYITASTLVEEKGHVRATFIVERIPLRYRRIIEIMNGIFALGFCLIVTYYGIFIVNMTILTGERSETSLRFPMWITYLSVPIGTSLISLRYINRLHRLLSRFSSEDL